MSLTWTCRDREIDLASKTHIMGILNVTPDSFFDGGEASDVERAIEKGLRLAEEGADILDVGGESTRPGSDPVSEKEELRRVTAVVRELAVRTNRLISVDTTKAAVARRAMEVGAHIVNDVSACTFDPDMTETVRSTSAGVVLMHMKGKPKTMQEDPVYGDVVTEVGAYLRERLEALCAAGVDRRAVVADPGIGFGKTFEHNLDIIRRLDELDAGGRPLLVGLSRKKFLGWITGREVEDRLSASLAGMAAAILRGARIIRVHDVKESCDVAKVIDMVNKNDVS